MLASVHRKLSHDLRRSYGNVVYVYDRLGATS